MILSAIILMTVA